MSELVRPGVPPELLIATWIAGLLLAVLIVRRDRTRPWRCFGKSAAIYAACIAPQVASFDHGMFMLVVWAMPAYFLTAIVVHGRDAVVMRSSVTVNRRVVHAVNSPEARGDERAAAHATWPARHSEGGMRFRPPLELLLLGLSLFIVLSAVVLGVRPWLRGDAAADTVAMLVVGALALAVFLWTWARIARLYRAFCRSRPVPAIAEAIGDAYRAEAGGSPFFHRRIHYRFIDTHGRERRFSATVHSLEPSPPAQIERGQTETVRLFDERDGSDRLFWRGMPLRAERF